MKKIIFPLLFILVMFNLGWAQHVVFLKNGGILKGRVDGGSKDSLYLVLLGNRLKIAYNDINAIYLNDSLVSVNSNYNFKGQVSATASPTPIQQAPAQVPTPTATPATTPAKATDSAANKPEGKTIQSNAPAPTTQAQQPTATDTAPVVTVTTPAVQQAQAAPVQTAAPAQETQQEAGKIRGIISYYITKNNISQPDSGAHVWVVDSVKLPQFKFAVVDTFLFGSAYREIAEQYKITGDKVPQEITDQLKIWKATNDKTFDRISKRAGTNLDMLKKSADAQNFTVDKNGYFNITTKTGTYYVLISSEKVKGNDENEKDGKIFCQKIIVKKDQDSIIKNAFDVF